MPRAIAMFGFRSSLLTLIAAGLFSQHVLADDCVPWTWSSNKRDLEAVANNEPVPQVFTSTVMPRDVSNGTWRKPGEIICKYTGVTFADVNYYTCMDLATYYGTDIETFFSLNPEVKRDCSNVKPYSEYCVRGSVQPKWNADGTCGPFAGDTSCPLDSDTPCCNARTWKCGGSVEDCATDNCWNGICPGAKIFSVDGFCGPSHGNTICTGRWGKCCGTNDCCGNGADFCGSSKCQYGECEDRPQPAQPSNATTNETPDGTCGSLNGYKCRVEFGNCCSANGICGDLPSSCLKTYGCQSAFGRCD